MSYVELNGRLMASLDEALDACEQGDRIYVLPERRERDRPWRRPRTTDLRTGERVYKERRKMSHRATNDEP